MYNMNQPQSENVQNNSLGENIRKLRVLNSFSQEYVAANLEMSQGNYARMENGDISINSKRLKQIAYVLGYSPEFLKTFDSEKLGAIVEKEEKPVELLNLNISIELKELYEARIKVLETQIEVLKRKVAPVNHKEVDGPAEALETGLQEKPEELLQHPEHPEPVDIEKASMINGIIEDVVAEKILHKPNSHKADEIGLVQHIL